MHLLVDQMDSFTYNIADALKCLGKEVFVLESGLCNADEMLAFSYEGIILGPGPGRPKEAIFAKKCLQKYLGRLPILGICLGHQLIGEFFGATVIRGKKAIHGKQNRIFHTSCGVFAGLPQGFLATRYHSLLIDPKTLPSFLEITAWTEEGEIMGIKHKNAPLEGVQFHPESVATEFGNELFANYLAT